MKATEELMHEHDAILLMLTILDEICVNIERGAEPPLNDIGRILDFLKTFVDGCHHSKEEGHLFPVLESAGIPREHGPIGVMLSEHELGRKHIRAMVDAAGRLNSGDKGASKDFVSAARAYGNLLRIHITKENNVLFPLADLRIDDATQTDLLRAFERIETEKVGAGKHEQYHALLKELKGFYLDRPASRVA